MKFQQIEETATKAFKPLKLNFGGLIYDYHPFRGLVCRTSRCFFGPYFDVQFFVPHCCRLLDKSAIMSPIHLTFTDLFYLFLPLPLFHSFFLFIYSTLSLTLSVYFSLCDSLSLCLSNLTDVRKVFTTNKYLFIFTLLFHAVLYNFQRVTITSLVLFYYNQRNKKIVLRHRIYKKNFYVHWSLV